MPRHLYTKWTAGILFAAVFFGLAIADTVASLSPLEFDEDGLPFVWDKHNPLATLLPLGLCFTIGLILPLGFAAVEVPSVIRLAVAAAATGATFAAAVCCVLAMCIQTHIGSCLLWLLAYGFIAWRVWHASGGP